MVQFILFYVSDHMSNMQISIFPQLNQIAPVLLLVLLNGNPPVVVPMMGIIGEDKRTGLVLQVNDPVCVV